MTVARPIPETAPFEIVRQPKTATFNIEIQAGVDAVSAQHALTLVALDLLAHAYTDGDKTLPFGPRVPAGYVGFVDFDIRRER